MASLHFDGFGVERNHEKVFYCKSVNKAKPEACTSWRCIKDTESGVKDLVKARHWLEKVEHGNVPSMHSLAGMLARGQRGDKRSGGIEMAPRIGRTRATRVAGHPRICTTAFTAWTRTGRFQWFLRSAGKGPAWPAFDRTRYLNGWGVKRFEKDGVEGQQQESDIYKRRSTCPSC